MLHGLSSGRGIDDAPPLPHDLDRVSLFFDLDGTLIDLAPTPDAVRVDAAMLASLEQLAERMPGRVAIVSGRSLDQLDRLLGTVTAKLPMVGSHGAERRARAGAAIPVARTEALDRAVADLVEYGEREGLLVERKTLGAALHYRTDPVREGAIVTAAGAIAGRHGIVLQRGKMMVELRADGDKGRGLDALMADPAIAGTSPLFFGDDLTDEDGFVAALRHGGAGVLVGEPRPTAARYRLADPTAVHRWTAGVLEVAA